MSFLKKFKKKDKLPDRLPQHIAIVMDGNGRWAKKRLMPRLAGHRAGVETARQIVSFCARNHIPILSLFAFSSENWRRPQEEVSALMELFLTGFEREMNVLHSNNIQVRFIGNRDRFQEKLRNKIVDVEALTKLNTGMILLIAVDYGGQWDICQAMRKLAVKVEEGCLASHEILPEHITQHLSFADLPDPDFFIRTSGEVRISNFMLWQLAYSELYFTDILWPDFDEKAMVQALQFYAKRERRFGASRDEK